jgi:hypothetical protein
MFGTITWVIGFAAALLAFIFVKLADFDLHKAVISLSAIVISISIAGVAICLFALVALWESAKHIKNNWISADKCKDDIEGISEIVSSEKRDKGMPIWWQLGILVFLFIAAFILIGGIGVWPNWCPAPLSNKFQELPKRSVDTADLVNKLSADWMNQIPKIMEDLDTRRSAAQQATAAANAAGSPFADLEHRVQKPEQTTPKLEEWFAFLESSTAKQSYLSRSQWKKIQLSLAALGFYPGPIDGRPGAITVNAIREYQKWRSDHPDVTGTLTDNQVDDLLK